jgi:hypothetical protein
MTRLLLVALCDRQTRCPAWVRAINRKVTAS